LGAVLAAGGLGGRFYQSFINRFGSKVFGSGGFESGCVFRGSGFRDFDFLRGSGFRDFDFLRSSDLRDFGFLGGGNLRDFGFFGGYGLRDLRFLRSYGFGGGDIFQICGFREFHFVRDFGGGSIDCLSGLSFGDLFNRDPRGSFFKGGFDFCLKLGFEGVYVNGRGGGFGFSGFGFGGCGYRDSFSLGVFSLDGGTQGDTSQG
jgi:hypothetical protein